MNKISLENILWKFKKAKKNRIYPVLPLRNTVLFPNQIIPIYIGRKQSLKLITDFKGN